jgi:hypothetical protein
MLPRLTRANTRWGLALPLVAGLIEFARRGQLAGGECAGTHVNEDGVAFSDPTGLGQAVASCFDLPAAATARRRGSRGSRRGRLGRRVRIAGLARMSRAVRFRGRIFAAAASGKRQA